MNVFAVTPGDASSAGLDLLSLCTSNGTSNELGLDSSLTAIRLAA